MFSTNSEKNTTSDFGYWIDRGVHPSIIKTLSETIGNEKDALSVIRRDYVSIYNCTAPIIHQSSLQLTRLSGISYFARFPNLYTKNILMLSSNNIKNGLCREIPEKGNATIFSPLDPLKGEYEVHSWLASLTEAISYYNSFPPELTKSKKTETINIFLDMPYVANTMYVDNDDSKELPQSRGLKSLKNYDTPMDAVYEAVKVNRSGVKVLRTDLSKVVALNVAKNMRDIPLYQEPLASDVAINSYESNPKIINALLNNHNVNIILEYLAFVNTSETHYNYYKAFVNKVAKAYNIRLRINDEIEKKLISRSDSEIASTIIKELVHVCRNTKDKNTFRGITTIRSNAHLIKKLFASSQLSNNTVFKEIIFIEEKSFELLYETFTAFSKADIVKITTHPHKCIRFPEKFNFFKDS